jgi:hypothetical protein
MLKFRPICRPISLAIAALMVSACSGSASDPTSTNATAPKLSGALDTDRQQARSAACMARMEHYQQLGVWKHGGARPGVDRSAWDKLTDAEKSEIFDVAACIIAAGQTGERMVTVSAEGNGPEIETRRVMNDRDFATELFGGEN